MAPKSWTLLNGTAINTGLGKETQNPTIAALESKHLVSVGVSQSGEATFEVKGIKAYYGMEEYNDGADGNVWIAKIRAEAQQDTRSVSVSRAGAINEWHTNENGVPVTHGDTIYSSLTDANWTGLILTTKGSLLHTLVTGREVPFVIFTGKITPLGTG